MGYEDHPVECALLSQKYKWRWIALSLMTWSHCPLLVRRVNYVGLTRNPNRKAVAIPVTATILFPSQNSPTRCGKSGVTP